MSNREQKIVAAVLAVGTLVLMALVLFHLGV